MDRANISDRASIARLYPFAAFLGEANANVRARASIWRGVEIIAGPDAEGWFAMTRASRHAGEREVAGGARFLCPFAKATSHAPDYPAPAEVAATAAPPLTTPSSTGSSPLLAPCRWRRRYSPQGAPPLGPSAAEFR
jgi:hypothetical protein